MYPVVASKQSITVFFPEVGPKVILSTSPNYEKVKEALHNKAWDQLLELMDPTESITRWGNGSLSVIKGVVHIDGEPLASLALSQKVLDMWEAGVPIDPYIAFNRRLQKLSSHRMASVLFTYLDKHQFPLYDDGAFMAYKGLGTNPYKGKEMTEEQAQVIFSKSPQNPYTSINGRRLSEPGYYLELLTTKDYLDLHSGSVPQSVGDTVSMATRCVNDDPSQDCSTGLHVGSHSYTHGYSDRMLVRVYPANCISVPLDSNFSKIRVDSYTITAVDTTKAEYEQQVYKPGYTVSITVNLNDPGCDEDEDYDDEGYDDADCDEDDGEF
ncbi:hypothetical protein [Microcoleus phage My-WqHQDG]|nr:hypothetical protein [Microcoleus phage My-WqHQDG]